MSTNDVCKTIPNFVSAKEIWSNSAGDYGLKYRLLEIEATDALSISLSFSLSLLLPVLLLLDSAETLTKLGK